MKNLYFLGGLPRSGNTLLSSILNQNPNIFVSPSSPILNTLFTIDNLLKTSEETQVVDFEKNMQMGLKNFVNGFYSEIKKPIVIDRCKIWGNKESIYMLYKYIDNNPKIIFTVRDISDIIASFLNLIKDDDNNFIDNILFQINSRSYGNQTQDELRADWLMTNQIQNTMIALTDLIQLGIPVCIIEYKNLIESPQKELDKIYRFLEIDRYQHDFDNIVKIEEEDLGKIGLPEDLHSVNKNINKNPKSQDYALDESIIKKYSNLEFWRN